MRAEPILLCYDGSEDANVAIRRAAYLFGERGAVVLTVWQRSYGTYDWPTATYALDMDALDAAGESTAGRLAAAGTALAQTAGLAAEPLTVRAGGPVWQAILEQADALDAAAIVLGSRGMTGVKGLLLGSVAATVIQHSTRPALLVRHGAASATGPALIAYDGSRDARLAIERAGALLGGRRALVLTVWHHPHAAINYSWPGVPYAADLQELDEAAEDAARRLAAEGTELATAAGLQAEPIIARSPAALWQTILDAADERDASVVVLGSRGLSGLKTLVLGSVSSGAAHHARRPLLIARHGELAEPVREAERAGTLGDPIIG